MAGRLTRALKSSFKQDLRQQKIQGILQSSRTHERKSQSGRQSTAEHNTRGMLLRYTGDDPALLRAQSCFNNNLLKGQEDGVAYSNCGLTYVKSFWEQRKDIAQRLLTGPPNQIGGYNPDRYDTMTRANKGSRRRYGIGNLQAFETTGASSEWVNRRS